MSWSKEYCNLQHLGTYSTRRTWATVERREHNAVLRVWYPGCQFSPQERVFDTVERAKVVGEQIVRAPWGERLL